MRSAGFSVRPRGQSACRLQHFCSSLTCDEQEQEANGKCMGTIEAWDAPLAVSQATVAGGAGFKAASWSVGIYSRVCISSNQG